jgi:hypothetical protein
MASLFPVTRRRHAVDRLEDAVERLDVGIARSLRNLADIETRADDIARRTMETQPLDGGRKRFSMNRTIDPVPVIARHAGDLGKLLHIELFVEMIVDIG